MERGSGELVRMTFYKEDVVRVERLIQAYNKKMDKLYKQRPRKDGSVREWKMLTPYEIKEVSK
jgi:hypothetical protein